MDIIGITGTHGAGKGAIVDYLKKKHGFLHFSARAFLSKEVLSRGLTLNRESMHEVANELRKVHHPGYVAEKLWHKASSSGKRAIIESIRTTGEYDLLKQKGSFILIAVDADPLIRFKRITARKSATDHVSFESFLKEEQKEMTTTDPNKQNISACMKVADFTIINNKSLEILHARIDEIIKKQ